MHLYQIQVFIILRAYMESVMGHHIHVNNKIPGSGKEDLNCIKAYIQKEETS